MRFSKGVRRLLESGVSQDNFTLSSDAQGSLPIFNEKKEFVGIGVGKSTCLLKSIKDAVFTEDLPLETVIRAVTSNPAKALKLKNKGRIQKDMDADLCLLDESTLDIDTVIAKGRIMVQNKQPVVFGTFEERK